MFKFSRRGLFKRAAESVMAVPVAATVAQDRYKSMKAEVRGDYVSARAVMTTAQPSMIYLSTYPEEVKD